MRCMAVCVCVCATCVALLQLQLTVLLCIFGAQATTTRSFKNVVVMEKNRKQSLDINNGGQVAATRLIALLR